MASFTDSRSNRATFANYHHQLSDEFQTQVETHEGGTPVLDDHVNALSNELVNNDGDTEVLEDSQELFHTKWAKWGSLEGKRQVSNEHKNNAGTKLLDVEGDTQIPDESDDMIQNQLLCTEDLDALSNGRIAVTNSGGNSSREMDHRKTSGASLTHSADKDDDTSGYVPLRFTEIRVESLIASGLAARNRAQRKNIIGAFSSENTSRPQQESIDKNDEVSVRVSPFSIEGTDDDDYVFVREPKDPEFRNGRKVKSSAVRKLFAEEVVSQTESNGIKLSDDTKFEEEPAEGGDSDEADLSYLNQEPNELAHAKALDFVEKFLKTNLVDIDRDDHGSSHGKNTNFIAHGKCIKHLVKKNVQRSSVGVAKAFDWDDNNEDEGGGAFFCKMKEELLKKESRLRNSLPPIRKSSLLDSEQLENIREGPKNNEKKRKLSYSDTRFVSHNKKKIVSAFETKAGRNYSNGWNWQPNAGKVSSRKNTPDMPVFGTDASADTSSAVEAMEPNLYLNNNKVSSIKKSTKEGFPEGWTKKSSVFNQHNLRTRARPHPYVDKVLGKSAQSIKISDGHEEGLDKDGSVRIAVVDDNSCANFIAQRTRKALLSKNLKSDDFIIPVEQLMEDSASAGRKTRSGNGQTTKSVTNEMYSSRIDRGHIGEFELIKSMNSKTKASGRSVRDQSNIMASHKEARPRRSSRLSKFANFDKSVIHPANEGSNGCTFGQDGLKIDVEAVIHTEASLDTRLDFEISEYAFKVSSEDSFKRLCRNSPFPKEKNFRKRACTIPEMPSGISPDSPQSIEMTGSSKIIDPERRHENDDNGSCITVRNQGKQSETMTCTPVAQRTRRASLRNNSNSAETVRDDYVKLIQKPAEIFPAKRSRTTSPIGLDPVQLNSKDRSFKVNSDLVCEVQLVELSEAQQCPPKSSDKVVCEPVNVSSFGRGVKLRRSRRLNGSSALNDPSMQSVNKCTTAVASGKQQLHNDYGIAAEEAVLKLEASPREVAKVPGLECVKPTDSIKTYEEASPICIGNDYYKISSKPKLSRPENKKEDDNLITCPLKRRDMTDVRVLFSRLLDEATLKQQKQEKFLIDEKSYILRDESKEKEIGFSMPVSLVAFQQSLLQNRRVFITPNTKPGREVITCLVKAARGQVIGRICRSALRGDNGFNDLLILSCEDDFSICQPFLEKGAPVYSSELLLQGIVTRRLEYERYRLFGDYIKRTR
uniref:BRCT domain-containing protein n=2 Tax=Kalanchoe fedtschenkoi TaxID=63787 RepID=A0A7N0T6T8_KALFE